MDKEFMEEACKAIDAEIVGYTEITSDFQIEFVEDKTYEELEEIAEQLKEYDFVRDVFFNTVSEVDVD
jgi:FtsZ-interacting cell division protein YlmF